MRTHRDLLKSNSPEAVAADLGVSVHTVRSWRQRGSIPAEYWKALEESGRASLGELAEAAAAKRSNQDAA